MCEARSTIFLRGAAGIFPDALALPSAPGRKTVGALLMLQADFPGATGAACPQSPSHLPPDFNALPRELPRLFPSLGLGADRFFFLSPPQQLTQSCSATGKQRSFFFFFFLYRHRARKRGRLCSGQRNWVRLEDAPARARFKPKRLIYPVTLSGPLQLEHSSSPSPGCTTSFKGASPICFKHDGTVQKTLRLHHKP